MVHGQFPFQKRNPNRKQQYAQALQVGSGEKYGIFGEIYKDFMRTAYKLQAVNFTKIAEAGRAVLCIQTKDFQK
ncbi:MAG: hypothetical protein IJA49_06575 [Oscillospiraceae bacterium]|nr:hypothetical protein [Oscillospiraceae bacterium]